MTYAEEIVEKMISIAKQHNNLSTHEYSRGTRWYSYIRDEAILALGLKAEFEEETELIDGEIRKLLDMLE